MSRTLMSLAAAVAATLLLQLAVAGLGPFAVFLNLLVPLPVALLVLHRGALSGFQAVLLVTAVVWWTGGVAGIAAYLLQFGTASLLLPGLLRRGWAWDRAAVTTLVVTLLLATAALLTYSATRETSFAGLIDQYIQSEVATAKALGEQGELGAEQQRSYEEMVIRMGEFLADTFAAWVIVITGCMLLLEVLLLQLLSRGRFVIQGVPFARWKAPELLIWALIAAGVATCIGVFSDDRLAKLIGLNLLVVLLPVYFLQGVAVVTYFFEKKGVAPGLRLLGYLLIALLNPMPMIVTGVGVFDLWADFRKPRVKQT